MAMHSPQLVMYEEEFRQIEGVVERLVRDANGKYVFIIDKAGQLIAGAGEMDASIDTTGLASLTAGNIAASGGIAKLLREEEFCTQFHEGVNAYVYSEIIGKRSILSVIFDARSSLGLVRLRVRRAKEELVRIFDDVETKAGKDSGDSPFAAITDEDIDNLFGD